MPDVGSSISSSVSDLQFLRDKEKNGDLIHELSSEFSTDADQITYTVPNGKTFYLVRAKLYPVVNTVTGNGGATGTENRRADIEIVFDSTTIDILTYDYEYRFDSGRANSTNTWQLESNIFESLDGDGIKQVKLTSTSTSGTYRVSMLGFIEDT